MSLCSKYLDLCHERHQGITKCRSRAPKHFWWPSCSKDIGDFVAKCDVCIMHSDVKHKPLHESELPSKPWKVIASDVFVLGHALFVVIIDYYSKWIEAIPIETQTSSAIIV